ncbi:MAG: hypothetical protein K2Q20_03170, partial [Phycisphaerales bacterium]|nr:hypothetical protein [Phycisphaerales bacterium]
ASGTPCTPQNSTLGLGGAVTCTYERPCTQTGTVSFQPIFELVPNVVRVTVTGPGTVTSSPAGILNCAPAGGTCQFEFPLSAAVRLTANPTPGNWFTGWTQSFASGAQPGTAVSRELVLNLPATATTVNVGAGFAGNNAPVARCRNVTIDARSTCPRSFTITPADVNNGSSDPDQAFGDSIQLSLDNSGPFPVGVTIVTLTVRDSLGLSTSCQATVTVLGQDCNADTIPDVCQCFFDNTPGLPPQRQADAQLAHVGGGTVGGARVADDFYLAAGQVHRVFGFRGKMFTSALPGLRKARLDFFEDCDGVPAATPFASFTNSSIEQEIDVGNGFGLVSYFFDLCDPAAGVFPPPAPGKPAEPLWLDGGKAYWVSLTGLPASSGGDDALSFWVATPTTSPLIGRSPHKAEGTLAGIPAYQNVAWGPWQNLSECCIGCVNMEFALFGESCDCAFENGSADRSAVLGLPSGSVGSSEFRAVDNFVLPPCDPKDVCLIEGFVWTSCPTPSPIVEIYRDDCGVPSDLLIAGVANATATDLSVSRTLRGKTFKLWRIRASLPGITLPAGNYWLGLGASGTGSLNEETLFAASAPRCSDPGCTINGKPAVFRRTIPSTTPPAAWASNGTDLAFRVVTRGAAFWRPDSGDALPGSFSPTPPACRVDMNDNGAVGVDDIFAFLSLWFAGCP